MVRKDIREAIDLADKFMDRITDSVNKFDYPKKDVRKGELLAFYGITQTFVIGLDNFRRYTLIDGTTKQHIFDIDLSQHKLLGNPRRSSRLEFYELQLRACYLTAFMFRVEFFIRNLLDELGKNPNGIYSKIVERLIDTLPIRNKEYKKKLFNTPSKLRNSLHNSGYYNKNHERFSINVNKKLYRFVPGKKLKFVYIPDIFNILNRLLDVILKILRLPLISTKQKIEIRHF